LARAPDDTVHMQALDARLTQVLKTSVTWYVCYVKSLYRGEDS
jgi:hypothetical protein